MCINSRLLQLCASILVRFALCNRPLPWVSIFFPFVHLELLGKIFNSIVHLKWAGEEIL